MLFFVYVLQLYHLVSCSCCCCHAQEIRTRQNSPGPWAEGVLDLGGTGTESAQIWKLVFTFNLTNQPSWDDFSAIWRRQSSKKCLGRSQKDHKLEFWVPNWDQNPPIWNPFETSRGTFWRSGAHLNKKWQKCPLFPAKKVPKTLQNGRFLGPFLQEKMCLILTPNFMHFFNKTYA